MNMKCKGFLALIGALSFLWSGLAAHGDVVAEERETWARIGIAGEQRMLVQLINRSACLVMTSDGTNRFATEAADAVDRFEENLVAMTKGNEDKGLSPENTEDVLVRLRTIRGTWATFGAAARQIMHGDFHAIPVRQLFSLETPLREETETAAIAIRDVYQERLIARKRMATTIDLASRQQMLVMRMSKSFCYMALNLQREKMKLELQADMEAFAKGMDAMEFGDFDLGIVDPPSLGALMVMSEMRNLWTTLLADLQTALTATEDTGSAVLRVVDQSDVLVDLSGQMIGFYLK